MTEQELDDATTNLTLRPIAYRVIIAGQWIEIEQVIGEGSWRARRHDHYVLGAINPQWTYKQYTLFPDAASAARIAARAPRGERWQENDW